MNDLLIMCMYTSFSEEKVCMLYARLKESNIPFVVTENGRGYIGVGTPITMLFQVFIRENPNALFSKLEWYKWLLNPKFYLVRDFYKCVHG